jgi:hypothetical protein
MLKAYVLISEVSKCTIIAKNPGLAQSIAKCEALGRAIPVGNCSIIGQCGLIIIEVNSEVDMLLELESNLEHFSILSNTGDFSSVCVPYSTLL